MILSNATKQPKVIVASLKTISLIRCHRIVDNTTAFLVEGVVGTKESEIREHLPWIFNGWSLPQSIELNRDLYNWFECGLKVTLDATSKAKKGRHLDVVCILGATASVKDNTEFDILAAFWLKSEMLERNRSLPAQKLQHRSWYVFQRKGEPQKANCHSKALSILRISRALRGKQA